jgi:hypothetical protein
MVGGSAFHATVDVYTAEAMGPQERRREFRVRSVSAPARHPHTAKGLLYVP